MGKDLGWFKNSCHTVMRYYCVAQNDSQFNIEAKMKTISVQGKLN